MYSCYIGSIVPWAGTFAPVDWEFCCGQQLLIQQYPALYSIIGRAYGGDGITYFNLPDLQLKFPLNQGAGLGLPNYYLGETGGTNSGALTNVPYHNHSFPVSVTATLQAAAANGTLPGPAAANAPGTLMRKVSSTSAAVSMYASNPAGTLSDIGQLAVTPPTTATTTGSTGASTVSAFATIPPYLTLNYIIAVNGDFYPIRP